MGSDRTGRKGQLHRGRGESGNAGFSLVELLIAVTILAIIVIPLLHMFVTSTRINVKSRQTLRATTVAQDIMEGLKAYTLEEVRTQFSLPDGSASSAYFTPTEGFYVLNSSMIQGGVREITELEKDRDAGGDPVNPNDPDNEIYYFGIENLKMQGGEYDALIKLDASTYTESKAKDGDAVAGKTGVTDNSGHDHVFNGALYADVNSVSETGNGSSETDSSYHEPESLSKDVAKEFKKLIETKVYPDGVYPDGWEEKWKSENGLDDRRLEDVAILDVTDRTIRVEIGLKKTGHTPDLDGEGRKQCQARVVFQYTCKYDGTDYTVNYGMNGFGEGEVSDSDLAAEGIPRTFSSGNFYLFYYPFYKGNKEVDHILFNVVDGAELFDEEEPALRSVTLAKQIRSAVDAAAGVIAPDMADTKLNDAERQYAADYKIAFKAGRPAKDKLVFRTNIGNNLSEAARKSEDEGDDNCLNVHMGGTAEDQESIRVAEMAGDEVSGKATNVIYDIEITVFKTGAADEFKNLPKGGTTAQFEQYYRDHGMHKLATITNGDWN